MQVALLSSVNDVNTSLKRLNSIARLSEDTAIKSMYELVFKDCLLERGIETGYESFRLNIDTRQDKWGVYLPDFITEKAVDGRWAVFEPHGLLRRPRKEEVADVQKFKAFLDRYGSVFHFIVASDVSESSILNRTGIAVVEFCNGYWRLPSPSMGYECIKRVVEHNLDKLFRQC